MDSWLVLDSEAVSVLAHPRTRGLATQRADVITFVGRRLSAQFVIPTAVFAEVYQGRRTDSGVDRLSKKARVVDLDLSVAKLAGRLRRKAQQGSTVDAVVAATAAQNVHSVIATGDPKDLSALACDYQHVTVWSLNDPPPTRPGKH